MIKELGDSLEEFSGSINHTRCFLHILNLVVKSILRQFDLPKKKANTILNNSKAELQRLAAVTGNLENEELETQLNLDEDADDDSVEGWIDEQDEMSVIEREELDENVGPLRLMLTKVDLI
jgi:hypothetical protein